MWFICDYSLLFFRWTNVIIWIHHEGISRYVVHLRQSGSMFESLWSTWQYRYRSIVLYMWSITWFIYEVGDDGFLRSWKTFRVYEEERTAQDYTFLKCALTRCLDRMFDVLFIEAVYGAQRWSLQVYDLTEIIMKLGHIIVIYITSVTGLIHRLEEGSK